MVGFGGFEGGGLAYNFVFVFQFLKEHCLVASMTLVAVDLFSVWVRQVVESLGASPRPWFLCLRVRSALGVAQICSDIVMRRQLVFVGTISFDYDESSHQMG
ncbi:hypothetical protein M0R45_020659 [Rubus argutus]|uniref:Uncharacterized protein n=1 Tax=Rubus argutus TaxID=59490 RepID=A0AAW1XBB6_RUBAR